jgi:hypothetical protein
VCRKDVIEDDGVKAVYNLEAEDLAIWIEVDVEAGYTAFFFNWYSGGCSPIGSTRHCSHQ